MNIGRNKTAGSREGQRAVLLVAFAGFGEDLSCFKQAHVIVAAVKVVRNHIKQAGQQRVAHEACFFVQRISQQQRVGSAEGVSVLFRDEGDRDGFVVAQRQHGIAQLGVLLLVGQRDHRAGK